MTELTVRSDLSPAILEAVSIWADNTTNPDSQRRLDLLRDKSKTVAGFFEFIGLGNHSPADVTASDIKAWVAELEQQGLSQATIYAKVSKVSSFYDWLATDAPEMGVLINPARLARPKAPKPYTSKKTRTLSQADVVAIAEVIRGKAETSLSALRDFAIFNLLIKTGLRRAEVIGLTWQDLDLSGDALTVHVTVKGGDTQVKEVADPGVRAAILDYLEASGRLGEMEPNSPLWTSHDRTGLRAGNALSSHVFAKNLKKYAEEAGLDHIHIHQTRHTYAENVLEATGDISAAQQALGHKNQQTTRIYARNVATVKDRASQAIADKYGF